MRKLQNTFAKLILILAFALSAECLSVVFAGSELRRYDNKMEQSEMTGYRGRPAEDLMKYYMAFYLIWFLSQGIAVILAIILLYDRLKFRHSSGKYITLFLMISAIILIKWMLEPWFVSLKSPDGVPSLAEVGQLRKITIPANILIAAVMIMVMNYRNKKNPEVLL